MGSSLSRRMFVGGAAALASVRARAASIDVQRGEQAFHIRQNAAKDERNLPDPDHLTNGDEQLYPNRIASYSKGLPHDSRGEVDPGAYNAFLTALDTASTAAFENLTLGSTDLTRQRKFVNPLSGVAFDMEGADCHHLAIAPAPAFASAQQAGEAVELYWMALLRDVSFADYASNPMAQAAATELSHLADFRGPKSGGQVTTSTLFRGNTPGDVTGPFISQFLWRPIPYGAQSIDSRQRTLAPGLDYMTQFADWLSAQRGVQPLIANQFDPTRRYVRNARDLGQWVHMDVLFQAYFNAALILMTPPDSSDPITGGGIGAAHNSGNPYNNLRTMQGFGTFGDPAAATLVAEVATRALKAVWHQKWFVHRRARPEVFGGRVHNRIANNLNYPIHSDVLNSNAVAQTFGKFGTYLLPQAFVEGSPLHPSYGAGHATVAGACVTILKALFDETFVIPNPVVASADGLSLLPYIGPPLTVGGELNKLAANIATGRNMAGIHWRTDLSESLTLGESVAISILRDQRATYAENFNGFTFTRFNGTSITV